MFAPLKTKKMYISRNESYSLHCMNLFIYLFILFWLLFLFGEQSISSISVKELPEPIGPRFLNSGSQRSMLLHP